MLRLKASQFFLGLARLSLGWIFLWAFLDKVFGLGFATAAGKSWLAGTSPTIGFLKFATKGPFSSIYQSMAGNPVVDWMFMIGLLCLGVALILGIGVRIAGVAGTLLLLLMYTAVLPPTNNPFMDDHLVYAFVLLSFVFLPAGEWLGFGASWSKVGLVRRFPWLK